MSRVPLHPAHPERVCWGCELRCPAKELACGNGSERTPHPVELFGDDWFEWSQELRNAGESAGTDADDAGQPHGESARPARS